MDEGDACGLCSNRVVRPGPRRIRPGGVYADSQLGSILFWQGMKSRTPRAANSPYSDRVNWEEPMVRIMTSTTALLVWTWALPAAALPDAEK